jgi:hypothetical protein
MSTPKIRAGRSELVSTEEGISGNDSVNLRILKAMNGKAIEIRTYTKNPHGGHDQLIQLYIVPDDVRLTDAITRVLVIKALEDK